MAEAGTTQYRQELVVRPLVLGGVRRIVKAYVRLWGFAPLAETAALCVHELLTNVPRHTDSPQCELTLDRHPDRVRVTVSDSSRTLPAVREPDWVNESGRGLVLLDQMTDAWGADPNPDGGKDVWFEMRATPHREAA
ncbi:ATP-binding protein [Streptomyces sp. NBC_01187]|uniref:ATP-binding protein n=1 Tax=Streptomyces sp. NBC_01187 TaxID=2903766 RepID=UPI0038699C98|nr:ATP-binding protein [Streptomyces sp. NBC_01187]